MPHETEEDRQEAERLKRLPKADQRAIIAFYRDVAAMNLCQDLHGWAGTSRILYS